MLGTSARLWKSTRNLNELAWPALAQVHLETNKKTRGSGMYSQPSNRFSSQKIICFRGVVRTP